MPGGKGGRKGGPKKSRSKKFTRRKVRAKKILAPEDEGKGQSDEDSSDHRETTDAEIHSSELEPSSTENSSLLPNDEEKSEEKPTETANEPDFVDAPIAEHFIDATGNFSSKVIIETCSSSIMGTPSTSAIFVTCREDAELMDTSADVVEPVFVNVLTSSPSIPQPSTSRAEYSDEHASSTPVIQAMDTEAVFVNRPMLTSSTSNPQPSTSPAEYADEHASSTTPVAASSATPPIERYLQEKLKSNLLLLLPDRWTPYVSDDGVRIGLVPSGEALIVQRSLYFGRDGRISAFVHCKKLSDHHEFWEGVQHVELTQETVAEFSENMVKVVAHFRSFEVCTGVKDFEKEWRRSPSSEVDLNRFKETRYQKCCRSAECVMLVKSVKIHRCNYCAKLWRVLSRHNQKAASDKTPEKGTNFTAMNTPQKKKVLRKEQRKSHRLDMENRRLKKKIQGLVEEDGVDIDDELSKSLSVLLNKKEVLEKLTPFQTIFMEEQLKAAAAKSPYAVRWHPAMVRLALTIQMTSPKAYEELRGLLRLPSERQLQDYSHVFQAKEGIQEEIIIDHAEQLKKNYPHPHQWLHFLTFDGMKIRKNLVFSKKTGQMTGYVHLDKVQEELAELDRLLSDEAVGKEMPSETVLPVAEEIVSFMVGGIDNDLKSVVAVYPCSSVTSEVQYEQMWDVVGALELNDIRVLTLVCDGCGANISMFEKHTPREGNEAGNVYVTTNLYAPERPLFLMNDPPHLLKTLRNCLYSSGKRNKKGALVRDMTKNGQKIMWKTVISLYERRKKDTLRKLFKLNQEDVFLTANSVMRVGSAARVLSRSVAEMVRELGWVDAEEFAKYCTVCNDFFDMLNGASDYHATRERNDLFKAYSELDDERYEYLEGIRRYFQEWRDEVHELKIKKALQAKQLPSAQTMNNLDRTIQAFIGTVKFVLSEGKDCPVKPKVKARKISQDPLENYNSKQRAKLGANKHPDLAQALQSNVNMHMQSKIALRGAKKSNTGGSKLQLTKEELSKPLPKKKSI